MESSRRQHDSRKLSGKHFKQSLNSVSPSPANLTPVVSNEASKHGSSSTSSHKHSRWHLLQQKQPRVGVVPVDENHAHHKLLTCIRQGLRQVLLEQPENAAQKLLTDDDFNDISRTHGQEFECESYAGPVFATLRQAVGVDEQNYLNTVAMSSQPYLEFRSNSKSGQDFFLSHDMQFIFKSNRKRDVRFFLSILPKYLQHFIRYPHSLLVKYVGCYTIKMVGRPRKYFLVMQSIFYPADRIESRFDIKGCTAGRYQEPIDPDHHVITVLKDQNFLNEELDFGDQGLWFLKQVSEDSKFLCELNCMDYSLLIGRQRKHADEITAETLFTLVTRTGKSISPTKTHNKRPSATNDQADMVDNGKGDHSDNIPNQQAILNPETNTVAMVASSRTIVLPSVKPGIMFPRSLADGVAKFQEEHRRLLLKCPNELHIIDGGENRYFLGIVDFLTRFDWRQKTAQYWKMIKYGCGDHSTKRPDVYQQRFVSFLSDRVKF